MVAASSLSIGSGVVVIVSFGAHLTTSARFRVRAPGPYPASYTRRSAGGTDHPVAGCLSPFGCRRWLLGHPVPAEGLGSPCGRLTRPQWAGPRRGFRVSHARAAVGVGALSTPGTTVLLLTGVAHRPAPAVSQRRVPAPRYGIPSCGGPLDEASTEGSNDFTRPTFPSPVAPGWNGSVLGLSPELRTPPLQAAHVGVGTGHRART